jgi:predicted Holliday junction resolvase-like endonuclease
VTGIALGWIGTGIILLLLWFAFKPEKKESDLDHAESNRLQREYQFKLQEELTQTKANLAVIEERLNRRNSDFHEMTKVVDTLQKQLEDEAQKNAAVVSQRISSEVKMGAIAENAIGFMKDLPYDFSNMKHLGCPIDYIYFDYKNRELVLVEIKSAKATESTRQKLIKNIVRDKRIAYEVVRIDESGVSIKRDQFKGPKQES